MQPSALRAFPGKSWFRAPARSEAPARVQPTSRERQALSTLPIKGARCGVAVREALGGARSPRSSSPSLNWPLSLIRGCRSSSGCCGSRAGLLSWPGLGAATKGVGPRGGGGTAGPEGLRRSLPEAGSMARGSRSRRQRRWRRRQAQQRLESEVRGAAALAGGETDRQTAWRGREGRNHGVEVHGGGNGGQVRKRLG